MTSVTVSELPEEHSAADSQKLATLLMISFAVLWALIEVELGVRLRQPYDLTQIVWCRYAAHLLIVAVIWGRRNPARIWRTARPGMQLGRSLLMLIMPLSFGFAIATGDSVAGAWAVFWLSPLLILLLARVICHEQVPALVWLSTGVAALGAVAIIRPPSLPAGFGLFWPIVMALSLSLYVVLTRALRREALSANLFYTAVGVLIPLSLYVPRVWVTPSAHDAVILFGIGALGFVALLALDRSSDRATVSSLAAFLSVQVVTVCAINLARHRVGVTRMMMAGLALLLGALAVQFFAQRRRIPIVA